MPSDESFIDPLTLLRPRRVIRGMSAILLPMRPEGGIDWEGFAAHITDCP